MAGTAEAIVERLVAWQTQPACPMLLCTQMELTLMGTASTSAYVQPTHLQVLVHTGTAGQRISQLRGRLLPQGLGWHAALAQSCRRVTESGRRAGGRAWEGCGMAPGVPTLQERPWQCGA